MLYPNQALPPPVYTNISKLQAAAQRGVVGVKKDASSSAAATGSSTAASSNGTAKSRRAESPPMYDTHQSGNESVTQTNNLLTSIHVTFVTYWELLRKDQESLREIASLQDHVLVYCAGLQLWGDKYRH